MTPTHVSCTTSSATLGLETKDRARRSIDGEYSSTILANIRSSPARSAATIAA